MATIPLVARKGRASYLGERSAGHQDPGATSSYLLLRSAAASARKGECEWLTTLERSIRARRARAS